MLRRAAAGRNFEPLTFHAMAHCLEQMGRDDLAIVYYELACGGQELRGAFRPQIVVEQHQARRLELGDLPRGEESTDDMDLLRRIGEGLVRTMREFDAASIDDLFSDGLLNVMAAPEFDRSDKVRRVFAALENRVYLGSLVEAVARAGTIQIFIGHENRPLEMQDVSLVLAPYGRIGHAIGVVGVLGPTRMPYAQAIASVEFVSGLMNELVEHLYA